MSVLGGPFRARELPVGGTPHRPGWQVRLDRAVMEGGALASRAADRSLSHLAALQLGASKAPVGVDTKPSLLIKWQSFSQQCAGRASPWGLVL